MGAFVLAVRKDLLSRKLVRKTLLRASGFKHLNAAQLLAQPEHQRRDARPG